MNRYSVILIIFLAVLVGCAPYPRYRKHAGDTPREIASDPDGLSTKEIVRFGLILQKQLTKGLGYLEKAAKITPRSSRVWMALFQAYRLKGDEEKTRDAADQLTKFFKAEKATVEQQEAKARKKEVAKPEQKEELELEMPVELNVE